MPSVSATRQAGCGVCGTPLSGDVCVACSLRLLLEDPEGGEAEAGGEVRAGEGPVEGGVPLVTDGPGGRYRLKRKIASGGMGVVWAAEDTRLGRKVALKMLRGARFADEGEMARFSIEAAAAAGLDHPHIVPVYEVGRLEGQPFFTMKLIEGGSLAQRLREGGPLPQREAAELMAKMARAVQHAHSRGVLHRDLKPGNIMIDPAGEPWLTDFGLAKVSTQDSGLTISSDHLGTPHYMAPETAAGRARDVSTASDVWALGVILWETLTGRPPFSGTSAVEIMRRIVETEPEPPTVSRRIDADLLTLARACLEKSPARRPSSAGEVADELERWQRGEPLHTRPVSRSERFARWVRRKPAFAALYAALALGGLSTTLNWRRAEQAVTALTGANERIGAALRLSTANRLAAESRLQIARDAPVSLLLAAEAVELAVSTDDAVARTAAEGALMDALASAGGVDSSALAVDHEAAEGYIGRQTSLFRGLHFSPDGRWLVTLATENGRLIGSLHESSSRVDHSRRSRWVLGSETPGGLDVCWTADSRQMVSVGPDFDVRLWDLEAVKRGTGEALAEPSSLLLGRLPVTAGYEGDTRILCAGGQPTGLLARLNRATDASSSEFLFVPIDWSSRGSLGEPVRVLTIPARPGFVPSADRSCALIAPFDARARVIDNVGRVKFDVEVPLAAGNGERLDGPTNCQAFTADGRVLVFNLGATDAASLVRPPVSARVGRWGPAVSPDGRWLLSVGDDPVAWLTSLDDPTVAHPLRTSGSRNFAAGFSPDGGWALVGSDDRVVSAWRIQDLAAGAAPVTFRGLSRMPMSMTFSPDGTVLAAMGLDWVARRWRFDAQSAGAIPENSLPVGAAFQALAVSPDHRWIVGAVDRGAPSNARAEDTFFFDASASLEVRSTTAHLGVATSVAVCPQGRWLATAGRDNTVKVHEWPTLRTALENGTAIPAPRFTLSTSGLREAYARHLAFHPQGVLYCATGDGLLLAWDMTAPDPDASLAVHQVHSIGYLLPALAVSPNGRWLAVARHGWDTQPQPGSKQFREMVLVFDVSDPKDPKPRGEWSAYFLERAGLAFSPDSRWLAISAIGRPPMLWDMTAADPSAHPIPAPVFAQQMIAFAFSPDGQSLALGGADRRLHLWNWRTGALRSWFGFDAPTSLAWLPGQRLAAAGTDGRLRVWETNLTQLVRLARHSAGRALTPSEQKRFGLSASKTP